jgi:hypothetical protein
MMLNSVFALAEYALKKNLAEHFVEHFLLLSAFIAHANQIAKVYYVKVSVHILFLAGTHHALNLKKNKISSR